MNNDDVGENRVSSPFSSHTNTALVGAVAVIPVLVCGGNSRACEGTGRATGDETKKQ